MAAPGGYDTGALPDRLTAQLAMMGGRAPLCSALLAGAAADAAAGGVVAELFAGREGPVGSVPALRLLAALHRAVLARQAPELALHYPTVGGTAGAAGAWEAARRLLADRFDLLAGYAERPVQTNEVGRAAVLLTGLLYAAAQDPRPLRLLEIGASAGLNLNVDRYRYVAGTAALGPSGSPVVLVDPWDGPAPGLTRMPVIAERAGCDPAPVDPTTADGRLTLSSCVWADHVERFRRLGGALAVAADFPARVDRADAAEWLDRRLREPYAGPTVVWQSVVQQYMDPIGRADLAAVLAGSGPLLHLAMEPSADDPGRLPLVATTVPGGAAVQLATAGGHGPPVMLAATPRPPVTPAVPPSG